MFFILSDPSHSSEPQRKITDFQESKELCKWKKKNNTQKPFLVTPFPSQQVVHLILQLSLRRWLKPAIILFLTMFCIGHNKHPAANEVSQGLYSGTKHSSKCEEPPEQGSFPRARQSGACSPLLGISGSARTHTRRRFGWLRARTRARASAGHTSPCQPLFCRGIVSARCFDVS